MPVRVLLRSPANKLSLNRFKSVDDLLAACVKSLFAMRTLRQQGLYKRAPASVSGHRHCLAVVCFGDLVGLCERRRIESSGSFSEPLSSFRLPCSLELNSQVNLWCGRRPLKQDSRNSRHLLHGLLNETLYEFRVCKAKHNLTLPIYSSAIMDCNFINRMLYKDLNYSSYSQLWSIRHKQHLLHWDSLYISLIFQFLCLFVCLLSYLRFVWYTIKLILLLLHEHWFIGC